MIGRDGLSPCHTVIVVDDDEMVRKGMSSLLRSLGYRVELYDGGEALLASFSGEAICIVSDIQMPGMSGLELQSRLVASWPGIPIIFMTAFPDERVRARAMAAGAVAFLEKPCDVDHLTALIARTAGRSDD